MRNIGFFYSRRIDFAILEELMTSGVNPVKHLIAFSAALITSGNIAVAGSLVQAPSDPIIAAPAPVAPTTDWSGFYVGGLAGIQTGEVITFPALTGPAFAVDGVNYGGFVGYNFQQGSIVYGVEVAAQMGNVDIGAATADIDYLVDARARIGYAFDNVLVYAAGGYTMGQVTIGGLSADGSGFNLGAGVEVAVTDNVFIGGEYIYRNLSGTSAGTPFDYDTHGVQVRVGFRF